MEAYYRARQQKGSKEGKRDEKVEGQIFNCLTSKESFTDSAMACLMRSGWEERAPAVMNTIYRSAVWDDA